MKKSILALAFCLLVLACGEKKKEIAKMEPVAKMKVLLLDGQNNHYIWPKTTQMMKDYLEQTGMFEVDVHRMDSIWLGFKYNKARPMPHEGYLEKYSLKNGNDVYTKEPVKSSDFSMDFSPYNLVVSNLGEQAANWPEETQKSFENYMKKGGGLVVVHAANNSFGQWEEYNKMIGLGAWGGRNAESGPYAYYNDKGELVVDDSEGMCGSHGKEYEFEITTRAPEHPIMKGIPEKWLHTQDEMYERMRGPFENAIILATAFAAVDVNGPPWDTDVKGTGQHVPMLMAIEYGKGKVFHTTLGHFDYSQECVGFITTLQRGAEWAATGAVTQEIPTDFPTADKTSSRAWSK
ncbi:ThuA domain-containing protein [Maribacter sp. 2210JD10-5]|uniref:ThuA domain-containing protein n=1 Tax=Maribacter sp. 2210JD10-5 TaxID=3386272 RepID=UPI0039BC3624